MRCRIVAPVVSLSLAMASLASAQAPAPVAGAGKTAVYLQGGVSSGSSDMGGHVGGAALGATVARDLGSRLAFEATGSLLSRGMGSSAQSLSANLLFYLRPSHEKATPYLAAGGGIYRSRFDMGNGRFYGSGMMGGGSMMGMGGYGMMGGGGSYMPSGSWDLGQMPMFYGNRVGNRMGSEPRERWGHQAFVDPAVSLGGGIRLDLGPNVSLRPDGRALVVMSGGDTYAVPVLTVSVGYRF